MSPAAYVTLPAAASAFYVPCFLRRRPLRPVAASAFSTFHASCGAGPCCLRLLPLFTFHASCGAAPCCLRLLPHSMPPPSPLATCSCFRFLRSMLPAAPTLTACGCFRILCLLRRPCCLQPRLPGKVRLSHIPKFQHKNGADPVRSLKNTMEWFRAAMLSAPSKPWPAWGMTISLTSL